jgi:hypothetical protein
MKTAVFLLTVLFTAAQSDENGFTLYDGPLAFRPLTSNTFEPRVGLIWHTNNNRLRLDIGNSIDLVRYKDGTDRRLITFGADFFTYTLLKGESDFHFPVDAVDYLFGISMNYRDTLTPGVFSGRLRLSHISAHFVDGHYDGTAGQWKDGLNPRVYSREFAELTLAYEPTPLIRWYAGGLYLWHVDPAFLPKLGGYFGGEIHYPVFSSLQPFGAYQLSATGFRPRHEIYVGMKIGQWNARGTKLFLTYHIGNSIHGEYYDRKDEYTGAGFTIDL